MDGLGGVDTLIIDYSTLTNNINANGYSFSAGLFHRITSVKEARIMWMAVMVSILTFLIGRLRLAI